MIRAILLSSLLICGLVTGLLAQEPRRLHYADAKVIKIDSTSNYYEYTVETGKDGYVVRSPRRLAIAEGSHIKVAISGKYVLLTDEDGRPNETFAVTQYRLPVPPPPKKDATWFDRNRKRTLPLNLHG